MAREKETWLTLSTKSSQTLDAPKQTDPELAARLARQMFGCYRASDANDAKMFLTAAAATLALYPEEVARKVADPLRGLPARATFLPAIAEIRKACETEMVWDDAVGKRERERKRTAALLEGSAPPTADEKARVRALADTLFAELGARRDPVTPTQSTDFRAPRSPAEAEVSRRFHEARLETLREAYREAPPAVGGEQNRDRGAA
jgi:hypothetical protein